MAISPVARNGAREPYAVLHDSQPLVTRIHACPTKLVLYVTGGGSQAIGALASTPGASATVLEASLPYAGAATAELLGSVPVHLCTQCTAEALAKRAYGRAAELSAPGEPIIGIACTASLASTRPKKGDHRCYIACQDAEGVTAYSVVLEKGARSRAEEEAVCASAILAVAGHHVGLPRATIPQWPSVVGLLPTERLETSTTPVGDPVAALLDGRIRCVEFSGPAGARQVVVGAPRANAVMLPGSFNPLHDGHMRLLEAAQSISNPRRSALFELCVRNPDKGAISAGDIAERLQPFHVRGLPIVLTDASRFTDKAQLFKGARFVLGYDTAVRVLQPQYYGNSEAQMAAAFAALTAAGCAFTVAGRLAGSERQFKGLADIDIPPILRHVGVDFKGISEAQFRMDISSTDIRNASHHSTE